MNTADDNKGNIKEFIKLIWKITSQSRQVELKANWDGKQWRWTPSISGMKADEWNPDGIVLEEQPRMVHRNKG
jgi:hypothetical protein